jgi:hypothetical protein
MEGEMSEHQGKYRHTTKYDLVKAELINAEQYHGFITYQDIAIILGVPKTGSYMAKATGEVLGEISEDEIDNGRPMLSAIAIGVSGYAGPGFFTLARDRGLLKSSLKDDELKFWEDTKKAIYEVWKKDYSRYE